MAHFAAWARRAGSVSHLPRSGAGGVAPGAYSCNPYGYYRPQLQANTCSRQAKQRVALAARQARGGGGAWWPAPSDAAARAAAEKVSRGLQLQTPMDNPYRSCKLTRVRGREGAAADQPDH